jgi:hypothetical protein
MARGDGIVGSCAPLFVVPAVRRDDLLRVCQMAEPSLDGRYRKPQRPGDFQYLPGAKCWSRASPLFFQHGVTLFDQPVELLLLLSNPFRCSFFILCAGGSSSLFNQLSHIVLQYRDAVVEFR